MWKAVATGCWNVPVSRALLAVVFVIGVFVPSDSLSKIAFAQTGVRGRDKIIAHSRLTARRRAKKIHRREAPRTINLLVVSKPPNCKVFIDGEARPDTDSNGELEVNVQPGLHHIRVSRDGYVTRESDVEITSTPDEQEVEITLSPLLVNLNVITDPPAAEVYLDEVYKGSTNVNGLLVIERVNPTQPHTLRVQKEGYSKQPDVPITTYSGQISFKLLRDSITLRVTTEPAEADVYLDDAYKGTSTIDGLLLIEGVNPNQSHKLRVVKREGYSQHSRMISAGTSEAHFKLSPDPIVMVVRNIRRQVIEGKLTDAFSGYGELASQMPDHPELSRLLESILQRLQVRSTGKLRQVGFLGVPDDLAEAQEMSQLYEQAGRWMAGDEMMDHFARYWALKKWLAMLNHTTSIAEADALRRKAHSLVEEFAEYKLSNKNLLLDLGWAWLRLDHRTNAAKYFDAAQTVNPEWAYPHFAQGVLAMDAAEAEKDKSAKRVKYALGIDSFNKAINLKGSFARAFALRSLSYAELKQHEESIGSGLQAVALDPQDAYAHFALGFAYFRKGKSGYQNARNEFDRARALERTESNDPTKGLIQRRRIEIAKVMK
jgi:tetratricopeptide repeat protein/PEGA domain-containing protein